MAQQKKSLMNILILAMIPLFIYLVFIITAEIRGANEEITQLDSIIETIEEATLTSNLIHELQKERGYSAGFVKNEGSVFSVELSKQYISTIPSLEIVDSILQSRAKSSGDSSILTISETLQEITDHREKVQSMNYELSEVVSWYTSTIKQLIDQLDVQGKSISNSHIYLDFDVYVSFVYAKEQAGIERAMGAAGFSSEIFPAGIYSDFVTREAMQDLYLSKLETSIEKELRDLFVTFSNSVETVHINNLRDSSNVSISENRTVAVTASEWFQAATNRIDKMKILEDTIGEHTISDSSMFRTKKIRSSILKISIEIIVLLISLLLFLYTLKKATSIILSQADQIKGLASNNGSVVITDENFSTEVLAISKALFHFQEQQRQQNILIKENPLTYWAFI